LTLDNLYQSKNNCLYDSMEFMKFVLLLAMKIVKILPVKN